MITISDYKAHIATLHEIFAFCAHDWKGATSVDVFVEKTIHSLEAHASNNEYFQIHYLVDTDNEDRAVAMCKVILKNGIKREESHSCPAKILYIAYVFVHHEYRKLGLASSLLGQVISHWEKSQYLDANGLDQFPSDVYWALHSGVKLYYSRFGFQQHPVAIYQWHDVKTLGEPKIKADNLDQKMTQNLLTNDYFTSYRRNIDTAKPRLFYDLKANFSEAFFIRDTYVSPGTSTCKGAIVKGSGSTSFIVWCDNMPQDSLQVLKFFTDVDDKAVLDGHYTALMSALMNMYKERFPRSVTPISLWQTDIAARSEVVEKYITTKMVSAGWKLDATESFIPMLKKYRARVGASVDDVVWEDSGFLYFD